MPLACLAVNASFGGIAPALAYGSRLNISYLLATFVFFNSAMRLSICV